MLINIVFNIDINLTHIQTVQYFDNLFWQRKEQYSNIVFSPVMCQTLLVVTLTSTIFINSQLINSDE